MVTEDTPTMLTPDGECNITGKRSDCDGECEGCELYQGLMAHRNDPCNGCIDGWFCFYPMTKDINRACGTKMVHMAQTVGIDGDDLDEKGCN